MTFAVINTGGKQYKVTANDKLRIERLPEQEGKSVEFNEVLMINNNQEMELGAPLIEGAKVEAKILKQTRNKTVLIFKKRRRQNSRRKNGHRQEHTMIRINKIFSKDGKVLSEAEKIVKPTKKVEAEVKEKAAATDK